MGKQFAPTTQLLPDGETQKIERQEIDGRGRRGLPYPEFRNLWASRGRSEVEATEPRPSGGRQGQKALVGQPFWIGLEYRQSERQLERDSTQRWNGDRCHFP